MSQRQDIPDWLLSVQGRIARIVFGSLLIILGLGVIGGFIGVLLFLIGAVPIASAAYGSLLVGPLFGRDIHGRRPQEQPDEETEGQSGDEEPSESDEPRDENGDDGDDGDDGSRKEADEDWSAPPLARAERPAGQGPRTKDLRAEGEAAGSGESQG
jgi:hypothetical protein